MPEGAAAVRERPAVEDRGERWCVVGAGPAGLAAARRLGELRIPFDLLERAADVGGTWDYDRGDTGVYRSTHLISSKPLTEYPGFPMPADYPDYPSHRQALAYLRDFAHAFDLYRHADFGVEVARAERRDGGGWRVRLADGRQRDYAGLVVANGHHGEPRQPAYPGRFDGVTLHSRDYRTPEVLAGRRVLVVGSGNSGCDIAVEAAQHAERAFHSTRRGYHYVPKYVFGRPADQVGEVPHRLRLPLPARRALNRFVIRLVLGDPVRFGLQPPDHKLLETHPIVNSQLVYFVGHGDLIPKPDVVELAGDRVRFVDGTSELVDVIVYATGFLPAVPFLDPAHLAWRDDGRPGLWLNAFHPEYDDLFVIGLIQSDSGVWGLYDRQAQVMARFLRARTVDPARAERFRRRKAGPQPDLGGGVRYAASARHGLEIEHASYRRRLDRLARSL